MRRCEICKDFYELPSGELSLDPQGIQFIGHEVCARQLRRERAAAKRRQQVAAREKARRHCAGGLRDALREALAA